MVTFTTANCTTDLACHKIYRISNTFAKIAITSATFSEQNVPSCLYDGINCHEAHTIPKSEEKKFTEIYSLCMNKMNRLTIQSSDHTNRSNPDKGSHPYYMASIEALIVAHSRPHYPLEVNLRISLSEC